MEIFALIGLPEYDINRTNVRTSWCDDTKKRIQSKSHWYSLE